MTTLPDLILKYNRVLNNTQMTLQTLNSHPITNPELIPFYNGSEYVLKDIIKDLDQLNNHKDENK